MSQMQELLRVDAYELFRTNRVRDDKVHVRMIPVLLFGKFNSLGKDLLCIGGHAESCEFLEIILHILKIFSD